MEASNHSTQVGPSSMPAKKEHKETKHVKPKRNAQPKKQHKKREVVKRSSASFGSRVGAFLGDSVQQLISKVTGLGDYKVESNSLLGGNLPSFGGEMVTTFSRREYLGDVKSSIAYATTAYPINPGMSATFPWGARIAPNFEQYRLRGLLFEFKTTCGSAISSTNNALGVVVMSTQYDPLEAPFTDKREQEAYVFTSSSVPSQSQLHAVECKPALSAIDAPYVRTGDIPSNADLRMYDHGTFYISTSGMQAAGVTIGELWVTYHIELLKPRLVGQLASSEAMSWTMQTISGNTAASVPAVFQYTSLFASAAAGSGSCLVTFNPMISGLFKLTTRTFSYSAATADYVTHLGWYPGSPATYLGTSGIASIAFADTVVMDGIFSANWADGTTLSPQNSASAFAAQKYSQNGTTAPCDLQVVTEQWVVVDNSGGGTSFVRSPVASTGLSNHLYSLVTVERMNYGGLPFGFSTAKTPRRPPARLAPAPSGWEVIQSPQPQSVPPDLKSR